ncbi:TetR family transcriptional regulator [Terrabacter sp. NPDC080008]|uniref:TetR family transcriptional regulator n=1 Tax=Terrabacter sp. NPDC080008 TaxID=3155176 RepID=UPI00344DDCE4
MSTDLLPDEACGLRERKKRETRRALNLAALDLVEERGFAAVTTEEIAARAGVSARTFFNYFPSKEAAVIGSTSEELESYAAAVEEDVPGEPPIRSLHRIISGMLAPASVDPALRAKRRRVLLGEPSLAPALVGNNIRIENALTAALERRLGLAPGASLEPRLTVALAIAAVRACIEHQQNGGEGELEHNIDLAFDRVAAGVH